MIVLICSGLPLIWIMWQIVTNPHTLAELKLDSFRLHLLLRTIGYNAAAAMIAVMLSIPAAIVLGRGKGIIAGGLWFVLPVSLLMPSLAMTYGWKQCFRLIHLDFDPAGFADTLRCIWTLGAWLYPLPAVLIGLALRQLDPSVQEQALLDGSLWRTTFRQLLSPIIASLCIVTVLAIQEFAIYEPTGISVIATEVRMVFDTGGFSSPDNPITQTIGQGSGAVSSVENPVSLDQSVRASASVAASLPLLIVILVLTMIASFSSRRLSVNESLHAGQWPRALDAPFAACGLAVGIVLVALVLPIISMILSLHTATNLRELWIVYQPQLVGSIVIASSTGFIAVLIAILATSRTPKFITTLSLLTFLIGGQLLAIAMIRIYNRPMFSWIYNALPMIVIAHLARFGWIALFAGRSTFSPAWKELRDLSQIDGASRTQLSFRVILPIAWPLILAAALTIFALSLTEVPATVLISPQRPQPIIPMLMTWVHMLRYDAMIQASLMLCAMVGVIGVVVVILVRTGITWPLKRPSQGVIPILLLLLTTSCDDGKQPDEIWCETGNGPGQVIYPRCITYDKPSDTFFICDRMARIQRLDRDGNFLNEWRMPDWKQGKPVGLSIGPDGNLWVADTHYHRVVVYTFQGEKVCEFGKLGNAPGEFIYTTDIAFDSNGNVFVSEYGDHDRISVFDQQGKYLYEIGRFGMGDGEFSRPQSILIHEDILYVTDACNHRIAVFKTDGTFLRNMGSAGSGSGEFRFPYGLDIDSGGSLIIAEFGNNRVQKIDRQTGAGLATWANAGREPGQLAYPWSVCVDNNDHIIVGDAGNNRYQVFKF